MHRARRGDESVVRGLFEALHAHNASFERRFALADDWERAFAPVPGDEATQGVTLIAWCGEEPVGLAMLAGHTDSALFRHRRWAELSALYVVPAARGGEAAARLLAAGLVWTKELGYDEVRL